MATVVLQLVGAGRIALDDPLEKWSPGSAPGGERITLRQLLQHTGGIADDGESDRFRSLYGTTEAIAGIRRRTFGFETFSWTTGDGDRQLTVAVPPRAGVDPGARVNEFLTAAFSAR